MPEIARPSASAPIEMPALVGRLSSTQSAKPLAPMDTITEATT
jgi:hypothetical protein